MKVTVFEGTPEEYKSIAQFLGDEKVGISPMNDDVSVQVGDTKTTPKDAYRAMLNRIPISEGQMGVYMLLAEGELEYGEYLSRLGKTSAQIAGVHGALGRRINHTPEIEQAGLPGNMKAVMNWRKKSEGTKIIYYLSLCPDFIEVLKEEGII